MTPDIAIVTAILLTALVLLVSERMSVDLIAIGIMVTLMISGVLTPREAVAGFANPAPLTVGALLIATKGLIRTGSLGFLTRLMIAGSGGRPRRVLLLSLLLVGVLSAFMNNTPVVVLMLSVVIVLSGRFELSPARFLMPISFASILAGTTTLIGTSTNIIVSDQAVVAGLAPLGMFELARAGVPIALVGFVAIFFLSDRLLPQTHTPIRRGDRGEKHRYIAELTIPPGSVHEGREVVAALREKHPGVEVHEVLQGPRVCYPETDVCLVSEGDAILVSATAADLVEILSGQDAALPLVAGKSLPDPYDPDSQIVEAILPPESPLLGRRMGETFLVAAEDLVVIGAQRRRVNYTEGSLDRLRLTVGDILLIQCTERRLERLRNENELLIFEDMAGQVENRRKAPLALGIFAAMVATAAFGVLNILSAALAAAFLMMITGCLRPHEAYEAVDVPVLVLIIGTLALGTALTVSGAADLYAQGFLSVFHGAGPHAVLAALIVLTSLLSHVLSNNSTAVLLVPLGVATAAALGVDPRPFLIGVCFGASACFATPVGYQTNLLIYGPGGYRFRDFFRLGMVLNVIVWIMAALLIPRFWPF